MKSLARPLVAFLLLLCHTVKQTEAKCPAGQKSVATNSIANFCRTGAAPIPTNAECYCMSQNGGCPGVGSCVHATTATKKAVAQLYIDLFCRCPESGGLNWWAANYAAHGGSAGTRTRMQNIKNGVSCNCAMYNSYYSCAACSSGQYQDGTMHTYKSSCISTSYCATCTTCSSNQYQTRACGTSNRLCATCTSCSGNQYQTSPCSGSSNRQCANCLTCSATQYQSSPCSGSSNRQCASCTTCSNNHYQTRGCSGSSDRLCQTCTTCSDNQYQTSACSGSSNRQCANCLTCAATQYQTSPCSGSSNRQCANCQTCGIGYYGSSGCSGTDDRVCSICLTCSASEYATVECTSTTNRKCAAKKCTCLDGTPATGAACTSTEARCASCPAGRFEKQGACLACGVGKTQPSPGLATDCIACGLGEAALDALEPCTDCAIGTYQKRTVCVSYKCTVCPSGQSTRSIGSSSCQISCAAGTYFKSYLNNGELNCPNCKPGQWTNGKAVNPTSCGACPAGRYEDGEGSSACKKCPQGKRVWSVGNLFTLFLLTLFFFFSPPQKKGDTVREKVIKHQRRVNCVLQVHLTTPKVKLPKKIVQYVDPDSINHRQVNSIVILVDLEHSWLTTARTLTCTTTQKTVLCALLENSVS